MRFRITRSLSVLVLALALTPAATLAAETAAVERQLEQQEVVQRPIMRARGSVFAFARTELYFGTAKPDGVVTPEDFKDFLDREITPRFPDGLTVLSGYGQFQLSDGTIIVEDSYVLILLYPVERTKQSSARIETIRRLYRLEFQQQSVLRVDDPTPARVSF